MDRRKGIACVVGMTALVSACASYSSRMSAPAPEQEQRAPPATNEQDVVPPEPEPAGVDIAQQDALERLVAYAARMQSLTPAVLQSQYLAAQDQHRRAPGAYTRLQLAALISCKRAPFRDDRRARELLVAAADDARADTGVRNLATLWLRDLEERMALERALDDERRQRLTLQKKLDQLKVIEEEIDRRPAVPVVPSNR